MLRITGQWGRYPYLLFWLIPILTFLWMISQGAINVPYWDDYLSILWSLVPIAAQRGPVESLQAIFSQHNEHRLALLRLAALADWQAFGLVSFRHLAMAGNLFYFGVLLLLIRAGNLPFSLRLFAPLALLLLQWRFHDASLWSTASLSHYPVLFLAFSSLLLLVRPSRVSFEAACLLAIGAAYTQGNGLLLFPVGMAGLLLLRRYRRAALWAGLFVLTAGLYFHGYLFSATPSPAAAWAQPFRTLQFLALLAGAAAIPGESATPSGGWLLALSLVSAALLLTAAGYLVRRRADRRNPGLCLMALFLLGSSVSVGLARVGMGMEYALSSRYAIYSALLIAIVYLLVLESAAGRERLIARCGLAAASLVWAVNFMVYLPIVRARVEQLQESARFGNGCYAQPAYHPREIAESLLYRAEKLRIYVLPRLRTPVEEPCRSVDFYETGLGQLPGPVTRVGGALDTVSLKEGALRITGWVPLRQTETGQQLHIVLPREPDWRRVEIFDRPDVARQFGDAGYLKTGFLLELHYLKPETAAQMVPELCIAAASGATPLTLLNANNPNCRRLLR